MPARYLGVLAKHLHVAVRISNVHRTAHAQADSSRVSYRESVPGFAYRGHRRIAESSTIVLGIAKHGRRHIADFTFSVPTQCRSSCQSTAVNSWTPVRDLSTAQSRGR
eukprot:304293-Rhodomonas_salina.2